jgi:hypothetical protein
MQEREIGNPVANKPNKPTGKLLKVWMWMFLFWRF